MTEYTTPLPELLEQNGSHARDGLSVSRARENLERYGPNRLLGKKHLNYFQKFLLQLKDYMVLILLAAAVVSFVVALLEGTGDYIDSIIILFIVVLNAILGVSQESKAEKALDALQDMSAPTAKVVRDGVTATIPSAEVAPGDVVLLEAGDFIPADGRILESASLQCEESALTGESVPVNKDAAAAVAKNAPLGDRLNMVYSGCSVSYGRGRALITSTGMGTEMGKIATLLDDEKADQTPLQRRLGQLGKYLGIMAIVICAVILVMGVLRGMDLMLMFMTAVSLAVAAIPEGLTAVVTVVLAVGVQKMVKKNAIIRRLPAVETLGSASVICSDKTGTLTQNRMTVMKVWPAGGQTEEMSSALSEQAALVIRLGALCNDGQVEQGEKGALVHRGDPTETAIVAAALQLGMEKSNLEEEFPRVGEVPFDSDRKLMTTVNMVEDRPMAVVKGGFDVLLPRCVRADIGLAEEVNLAMGGNALRVLAVAFRRLDTVPDQCTGDELERDLTFVGLIGMIDPPREESADAVAVCARAGIKTVMITGDHVVTASAIAGQLGILGEGDEAVSGQELAQMSQEELEANVDRYAVYARVSPEDKIRIVKAWQARGQVVSMTGDGVNDAPALKAADIGCAMGITGTDVAKGAADMVLTDDNFSTIVEAVRQGRGIFDNIKKAIQFLLGSNLGEVFCVFFALMLFGETPLLAIHLLLVNVVTDALPALALGVEPIERDVMMRRPVPKDQGIFANKLGLIIVLQGVMVGALTLLAYYVGRNVGISSVILPSAGVGMTMSFLVLALSQIVNSFNCRSFKSLLEIGFFTNKTLVKAAAGSIAVMLLVCLAPPLEAAFKLVDMSLYHWLLVAGLSLAPLVIMEVAKAIVRLFTLRK